MIRDPSDGSVKPALSPEMLELLRKEAKKLPGPDLTHEGTRKFMAGEIPVIDTTTSGLQTGSSKPENMARLEKSREWLKQYRDQIERINRMNDKGEVPK